MTPASPSRRRLLLAAAAAPLALRARLSFAAAAPDLPGHRRFVFVLLRGGLDGLTAVPPLRDPRYAAARGPLAITVDGDGAALPLNGFFGLHPLLPNLHAMYRAEEMLVAHAVATAYRDRSHFDAQNILETGAATPFALDTGWLSRALHAVAPEREDIAVAIGPNVPRLLQGPSPASNQAPEHPRQVDADLLARVARMYAPDAGLAAALARAERALGHAGSALPAGDGGLPAAARAAARLLTLDAGPRVAVLESDGWDSHALQSSPIGIPGRNLRALDAAMAALRGGLGDAWSTTLVCIATEFGRTVAPNGSGGTDHGTAGALFLLGGAVVGGRVVADWPGLADGDLHERRDLMPTGDVFDFIAGALAAHWRAAPDALASAIAPDRVLRPVNGLVRT